jgi:hypothetical protein
VHQQDNKYDVLALELLFKALNHSFESFAIFLMKSVIIEFITKILRNNYNVIESIALLFESPNTLNFGTMANIEYKRDSKDTESYVDRKNNVTNTSEWKHTVWEAHSRQTLRPNGLT